MSHGDLVGNCRSEVARAAADPVASTLAPSLPATLWHFIAETCGVPIAALREVPSNAVPDPAQRLLVHPHDMTSTLSAFHGSPLHVEMLQQEQRDDLYLREVFLRTNRGDRIVEYGVIAIALGQFTPAQQMAINAGQTPLGALLHQFRVPFESTPIAFFSVSAGQLRPERRLSFDGVTCYGRFNCLAKPTGEPLAWIMEILPPAAS